MRTGIARYRKGVQAHCRPGRSADGAGEWGGLAGTADELGHGTQAVAVEPVHLVLDVFHARQAQDRDRQIGEGGQHARRRVLATARFILA